MSSLTSPLSREASVLLERFRFHTQPDVGASTASGDAWVAAWLQALATLALRARFDAPTAAALDDRLHGWRTALQLDGVPPVLDDEPEVLALVARLTPWQLAEVLEEASEAWRSLSADLEEDATRRLREGGHHTPAALSTVLVNQLLDDASPPLRRRAWLDPACGGGRLLLSAGQATSETRNALDRNAVASLHGFDLSPLCVFFTRVHLLIASDDPLQAAPLLERQILQEDALVLETPPWTLQHDITWNIILNPPFLSRRLPRNGITRERDRQLKARFGALWSSTADLASLFVAQAHHWAGSDGRVGAILPAAWLAVEGSAALRTILSQERPIAWVWRQQENVFRRAQLEACAIACIPHEPSRPNQPPVEVFGLPPKPRAAFTSKRPFAPRSDAPSTPGLSRLPSLGETHPVQRLGDLAQVTADFRQHFYGLAPHVRESRPDAPPHPRLLLTGHIDPAHVKWGHSKVKFHGTHYVRPVVDLASLECTSPALLAWAKDRLRPHLVVATQTRVLEAFHDEHGHYLNTTPTLTVSPHQPAMGWHLTAALLSPFASLWAWTHHHGSALSQTAIKLSARQLRELPLPQPHPAWDHAAQSCAHAHHASSAEQRWQALDDAARWMADAYGLEPDNALETMEWWQHQGARLRRSKP